jgi:hypothetical protein
MTKANARMDTSCSNLNSPPEISGTRPVCRYLLQPWLPKLQRGPKMNYLTRVKEEWMFFE